MKDNISLNTIPQRISCLRDVMHQRGISACIIPTGDPHMSEYVSDHDKSRAFITGFTGSAGTAVITDSDAGLWADSRYWLQAADQLEGSGIRLFRDGAPETPSIGSWLCHVLPAGGTVCVCGTAISHAEALRLEKALAGKGLVLDTGRPCSIRQLSIILYAMPVYPAPKRSAWSAVTCIAAARTHSSCPCWTTSPGF